MPNIQKVELKSKCVKGLQVRTKNADEMSGDGAKIAALWTEFYTKLLPTLDENATVYGVYHNYESDAQGEYDVLVGADVVETTANMNSVELEAGKYLMFPVKGELPQAIVSTWGQIWEYFEDESIDERRAFKTDFELYKSADEVEIYIGVEYL